MVWIRIGVDKDSDSAFISMRIRIQEAKGKYNFPLVSGNNYYLHILVTSIIRNADSD
jgi:hypothetical protein